MRSVYEENVGQASEIERTLVRGAARMCRPIFGEVCKAIWPRNTEAFLAAAAGYKSTRTASYEISGEREPSAHSLLAVMNAITPPRRK